MDHQSTVKTKKIGSLENFRPYSSTNVHMKHFTISPAATYRNVPGKRPWVLKRNSRFWPEIPYVCIEAATVAP